MDNRYFSPEPTRRDLARALYDTVKALPLICPHGHVNPRLLADPGFDWGTPVDLLIIPDHYIFRMLYSQGIALEELGIPRKDGLMGRCRNRQGKMAIRVILTADHRVRGRTDGQHRRGE